MTLHMDGARLANAVAATERSPADLTWRAGVDVLSFGGTKNGCVAAEAVVFFHPERARDAAFARQQMGHGFSKAWFIAAQFSAYLADDHWLRLAGHANRAAAGLAEAIRGSPAARLAWTPEANEVFAIVSDDLAARLTAAGALFHPWSTQGLDQFERPRAGETLIRLVTSWQTAGDEVERFAAVLAG
jgi:threonine aldolase